MLRGGKKSMFSHILPVWLTANTKGNKRSRTRTDSYTAGQSVGESTLQTVAIPASCVLFHNVTVWCPCRGPWGNRPWRDHAQETRDHSAGVHSLLQWVTSSSCCCRTLLYFSVRFTTPRSLAVIRDGCNRCAIARQHLSPLFLQLQRERHTTQE